MCRTFMASNLIFSSTIQLLAKQKVLKTVDWCLSNKKKIKLEKKEIWSRWFNFFFSSVDWFYFFFPLWIDFVFSFRCGLCHLEIIKEANPEKRTYLLWKNNPMLHSRGQFSALAIDPVWLCRARFWLIRSVRCVFFGWSDKFGIILHNLLSVSAPVCLRVRFNCAEMMRGVCK